MKPRFKKGEILSSNGTEDIGTIFQIVKINKKDNTYMLRCLMRTGTNAYKQFPYDRTWSHTIEHVDQLGKSLEKDRELLEILYS